MPIDAPIQAELSRTLHRQTDLQKGEKTASHLLARHGQGNRTYYTTKANALSHPARHSSIPAAIQV